MAGIAAQPLRYASFSKRVNAYGVDVLLVQLMALAFTLLAAPFPSLEQLLTSAPESARWFSIFTYAALAISAVYNILCVAGPHQATLGKRWCRIHVMDAGGGLVSLPQAALRHAASGISMLLFTLPFLTVAFTRERTAIHDLIARTRVVMN